MRVHAAYTQRLGPTELITYGPVEVADAASDDVVISTKAVALNPVDTYIRSGRFATRVSFPLILGRDVVGVVEQSPSDSELHPGQWVWANTMGFDGRQGSFATSVVAHRNRVYPLPQQVDPLIAVSLVHPATTAALGFAAVQVGPGDDVFIAGAGGNVGNAAVTYAATCGARVVANASPEDFARVKRAGAHEVVDYKLGAEDIVQHLPRGADVVWDCSGRMGYDDLATIVGVKATSLLQPPPHTPPRFRGRNCTPKTSP